MPQLLFSGPVPKINTLVKTMPRGHGDRNVGVISHVIGSDMRSQHTASGSLPFFWANELGELPTISSCVADVKRYGYQFRTGRR